MRRLIFASSLSCALLGGCLKNNPAWQGESDTGVGGSESGGSTDVPTTGAAGSTTTGAPDSTGGATDSQGDTTAAIEPTTTTGESSSGSDDSGSSSSTGAPGCRSTEWLPLDVAHEAIDDAGVVPAALGDPCVGWVGDAAPSCGALNFGVTEFFRLINTDAGRSAGLVRFEAAAVAAALAGAGKDLADVVGARVELVVWEPKPLPTEDATLEIRLVGAADGEWSEGSLDAQEAKGGDSSALCRTIADGDCHAWAAGDMLSGSAPLGLLFVDAAAVAMHEQDPFGDQYHALLRSEPLGPALAQAIQQGLAPSLAVVLQTARGLDDGEIGIKLKESPWADPRLILEVCVR
jgi:hypothetical protein